LLFYLNSDILKQLTCHTGDFKMADRAYGKPRAIVPNKRRGVTFNSDVQDMGEYNGCALQVTVSGAIPASAAVTADCGVLASLVFDTNLTYEAVDAGVDGNSISVEHLDSVAASLILEDLTYTADAKGSAGNSITIEYTGGASAGVEVVTVVGTAISVQIEEGFSTASQIATAVTNSVDAAALVDVVVSGTGTLQQALTPPVSLAGGLGGAAGSEEVVVTGVEIQVYIEDGVSTATQVAAAVTLSVPAAALVTCTVTGTGSDPANVTAQDFLAGGADSAFDIVANTVTIADHGLTSGTPVVLTISSGSLPAPLAGATTYYVHAVDASTLKICSSFDNSIPGTAINITADGTAGSTVTLTPVALNLAVKPQVSVDGVNFEDVGSSVNMSFTANGSDVVSISNLEAPYLRLAFTFTAGAADVVTWAFAKQ
jgi:hypothetical protein